MFTDKFHLTTWERVFPALNHTLKATVVPCLVSSVSLGRDNKQPAVTTTALHSPLV